MTDSRTQAGKIQDKPGESYCVTKERNTKKQSNQPTTTVRALLKGHRSQLRKFPMAKDETD